MPPVSLAEWNTFLQARANAHFLQTGEWGELKAAFGWEARRLIVDREGAQILFRKLPLGLTVGYVPKADLGPKAVSDRFWMELDALCRERHAILCRVEPDEWMPQNPPPDLDGILPARGGARAAPQNIQPRRTVLVDLRHSEDGILERMKQKCRYNIRLAEKKGVTVQAWGDLAAFHRMLQITGQRDGFAVHSLDYYGRAFELFHPAGMCELLVATWQDRPLAALMVFARGNRSWYVYGASTEVERSRMPNYVLQWEAMRWAKKRGCEQYDLWGVPDVPEATLESDFESRHDGLWGVYRFQARFRRGVEASSPS